VLANPKWQKIALFLNLAGTIVLFYSFQATSSDFRLVTAPVKLGQLAPPNNIVVGQPGNLHPGDKQYALCINNYTLLSTDASSGIHMAYPGCPSWENAKPAAVVNLEYPFFAEVDASKPATSLGCTVKYLARVDSIGDELLAQPRCRRRSGGGPGPNQARPA
jgi:hypothetical protein